MSQDRAAEGNEDSLTLLGELSESDISAQDRALISQFLGHFGISTEFIPTEELERRMRSVYTTIVEPVELRRPEEPQKEFSFFSISSPDQYLAREHFEDLEESRGIAGRGIYIRVFNYLVDRNCRRNRWINRPPEPPDLVRAKTREELGLGPYKGRRHFSIYDSLAKTYAEWAVNAGSIVDHAGTIPTINLRRTDAHILFMANQLQSQFKN